MAIARYSGMVMTILVSAILSRLLTPENYGVVALATVMLALFNLFADIGIGPAVIQNKTLTAEDMNSINQHFDNADLTSNFTYRKGWDFVFASAAKCAVYTITD